MAGRFIKLYDKILSWEWFQYPSTSHLFIYLLLKASYKDITWRGRLVRRGQLITSIPKISTDTGLTNRQIRTALEHLVSTGEIADELTDNSNRLGRTITIIKYDEYQTSTDKSTDNTSNKRQTNDRLTDRQTTDKPTASIEYIEQKEGIEKKNKSLRSQEADPFFDVFWSEYPKKMNKSMAVKAWVKLKPDSELLNKIMEGLARWKQSESWQRDNGRFIPYPASWLNGRRWEDEVQTVSSSPRPSRTVTAQEYTQRDYKDEQDEAWVKYLADMERGVEV